MINTKRQLHRLERFTKQLEKLEAKYKGDEQNFTFWDGYNLGWVKAKIDEIEESLHNMKEQEFVSHPCNLTNGEILLNHYKKYIGWIKGSKYKVKGESNILILKYLELDEDTLTNSFIIWVNSENERSDKIENCELIK